jgi:Rrf2 family protein
MFSKACEYGIRATIFIAEQSTQDRKVGLKEVASAIDSPVAYTSKILQQLSRHNIILSEKGPTGGFSMTQKNIDKTKLSEVVTAIDGKEIYIGCGFGLKKCNASKPCPVHNQFIKVREDLRNMLETTSIKSMTLNLKNGKAYLKR